MKIDDSKYWQTCNIRFTELGNKIVVNSDFVGALPVAAAPTTYSILIEHLGSYCFGKDNCKTN